VAKRERRQTGWEDLALSTVDMSAKGLGYGKISACLPRDPRRDRLQDDHGSNRPHIPDVRISSRTGLIRPPHPGYTR